MIDDDGHDDDEVTEDGGDDDHHDQDDSYDGGDNDEMLTTADMGPKGTTLTEGALAREGGKQTPQRRRHFLPVRSSRLFTL